jgi:helix-turn-helix protein
MSGVATDLDTQSPQQTPTLSVGLDPETIDQLAASIALRVAELIPDSAEDGWLDAPAAARYLGISTDALHKLTSGRELAFSQASPGGRCYFRRADLDAYRLQSMKAALY